MNKLNFNSLNIIKNPALNCPICKLNYSQCTCVMRDSHEIETALSTDLN